MSLWTRMAGQLARLLAGQRAVVKLLYGYGIQFYAAVVSLVFAPFILKAIGPEAYGLVGLFLIIQAWFQLLDAGLTPALTRETSRYRGGALQADGLSKILRGLESVVIISCVPVLALAWLISGPMATRWINRESLSVGDITIALQIIALILLLRWISGLRRGVLTGFEQHGTLYSMIGVIATLRFPGILLFFSVVTPTSTNYFLYQLAISMIEAIALWGFSQRLIPKSHKHTLGDSIRSLAEILPFAASHCLLAIIWILITQTDKLLLARFLSLSQFGYFSLAVAAAAGINLIVLPISQMLMPRLAQLHAQGDDQGLLQSYSRATRVMMVFLSVVSTVFACFGGPVMLAWTGDPVLAALTGQVLAWYAIGNAAMAISTFCYYIQFATGNLRLHTWGTAGFLVLLVPALAWSVPRYGMSGAAITWAVMWILYLLSWVTITHRQVLQGGHWRWLFQDVAATLLPVATVAIALRSWVPLPEQRLALSATLIGVAVMLGAVALLSSRLLPWHKLRRHQPFGRVDS